MISPEGARSRHEPGDQYDFFRILDEVVPNEDIKRFAIENGREFVFDPKERNVFMIFDYISQTTAEVYFDQGGNVTSLDLNRMGGEAGEIEAGWKRQHQVMAEKILQEHATLFNVSSH